MERREERIEASENYAKKNPYVYYSDLKDGDYDDADAVYDFKTPAVIFAKGAKWADKTMIDKAVKYLSGLTRCAVSCIGEDVNVPVLNKEQLEDFKKAMEK
jgi:hypothetical protein